MMVDISESEATEAGFYLRLKNYRTFEGTGVTFHCKTTGYPLPKVPQTCMTLIYSKNHLVLYLKNPLTSHCQSFYILHRKQQISKEI